MRLTKNLLILMSFAILALFSCQKRQYGYFNNHYHPYSKITKSTSDAAAIENKTTINENNVASTNNDEIQIVKEDTKVNSTKVNNNKKTSSITTSNKPLSVKEKKEIKKEIRKAMKNEKSGIATVLLVIIAIILPPLAVLLIDGLKGPFWLSLLLWLLFYVPGLIYALWRIFRDR